MALCIYRLPAGWQVTMIDCMGRYSSEYWSGDDACRRCERGCGCLKQSQLGSWVYVKDGCRIRRHSYRRLAFHLGVQNSESTGMAYYLLMIAKSLEIYLCDKPGVVSSPRLKISSKICKRRVIMVLVCCLCEHVCLFVCISFKASSERPRKALKAT